MRIFFIPMVCLLLTCSCNIYVKNKYGLSKEISFTSRKDYQLYLQQKKYFPNDHILYCGKEGYIPFFVDVMQQDSSVLYMGAYLNDTVRMAKSPELQANPSCSGRLRTVLTRMIQEPAAAALSSNRTTSLSKYQFQYLHNRMPFHIETDLHPVKLFLIYAQGFGTYYNAFYKEIYQIVQQNSDRVSLYIVCIEPVYQFK